MTLGEFNDLINRAKEVGEDAATAAEDFAKRLPTTLGDEIEMDAVAALTWVARDLLRFSMIIQTARRQRLIQEEIDNLRGGAS